MAPLFFNCIILYVNENGENRMKNGENRMKKAIL